MFVCFVLFLSNEHGSGERRGNILNYIIIIECTCCISVYVDVFDAVCMCE